MIANVSWKQFLHLYWQEVRLHNFEPSSTPGSVGGSCH
ncbi:hypothetical protein BVRB_4g090190 [Beta vulgaris subsp. vulgaris]|nr:hypothetical protein BVRB_4g090190 [Beta vulgaris subsp. vulgaris]